MTNLINCLFIIVTVCVIASCKNKPDGNYLVYDAKPSYQGIWLIAPAGKGDPEVQSVLKNAFMGKKFKITFDDDYITMDGSNNSYNNLILNKHIGPDSVIHYRGEKIVGNATLTFRMITNGTEYLILGVDCSIPREKPIIIPTQLGTLLNVKPDYSGREVFWLKKVNN